MRTFLLLATLAVLQATGGCTNEDPITRVAVANAGDGSIDATVGGDGQALTFSGVAAGTTSAFQVANLSSYANVSVAVGTEVSTVDLREGERNVVEIGADGRVERVSISSAISEGSEAAW